MLDRECRFFAAVMVASTVHACAGATAMCFQCLWPSRFSNGLLAAKILKDGGDPSELQLNAFKHEADVLSRAL